MLTQGFFIKFRWQPYLSFILIIGCLLIPDRDYAIKGTVYQTNSEPLSQVTINEMGRGAALNHGNDDPIMTDENGYYEISNSELQDCSGFYPGYFMFKKEGYKDFSITISIKHDMPETLDIIMERTDSALDSRLKDMQE